MSSKRGARKAPIKTLEDISQTAAEPGCGECGESEYTRMVQCDECDVWYHFECVNVTDGIEHLDWNCKNCGGENRDDSQKQMQ